MLGCVVPLVWAKNEAFDWAMRRDNGVLRGLRIARRRGEPLFRQLHARVRDAILAGRLAPGTRLPATRALALELGMARGTVEQAYGLLVAEGFAVGRGAAGTWVNADLAHLHPVPGALAARAVRAAPPAAQAAGTLAPPLRMGLPALDAFPRKLWARLAAREARRLPATALRYTDPRGHAALRRAVAAHLGIARGIACDAGNVFVTAGLHGALALVHTALLHAGAAVWCEDPGYHRAREALALAGARIVPVPVDGEGLQVEEGVARAPRAPLAMVTPSHQAPMGVSLSLPRRLALLDWAAAQGAWVLEDDYDGEYRYASRPLPALKSLDRAGRVLYAGSFSKVLYPGLRTGYLVVPDALLARFERAADLLAPAPAGPAQATIARFMEEGHFARHIRRMRRLYARRRETLAAALRHHAGQALSLSLAAGGMHLIGWLRHARSDTAASARAARLDLAPAALSPWCIEARLPPALLLSFTNVPEERADAVAARLARALKGR